VPLLNYQRKLSNRLQQIESMVTSQYDHIWDCCCDHGLLGFSLLSSQASSNIHFVDIVPELMSELEQKLQRFCPESPWQTHCIDVANLPLTQCKGKQLIIIAGVGGDLMIQFIEAIIQQHKSVDAHVNVELDFLLCPVHHQYALRQKLIELDFSLQDEVLVEENRRFYEILRVSSRKDAASKISPVGEKIWQSLSTKLSAIQSPKQSNGADKYLEKTLKHYQRIEQGFLQSPKQNSHQNRNKSVQHVIDAYRTLKS